MTTATTAQINYINALRTEWNGTTITEETINKNATILAPYAFQVELHTAGVQALSNLPEDDKAARRAARTEARKAFKTDENRAAVNAKALQVVQDAADKLNFALTTDVTALTKEQASEVISTLKAPADLLAGNFEQIAGLVAEPAYRAATGQELH
ncbi:hypothetical protein ACXM2N_03595 [Corynebacterium sp. ZY180755]